MTNAETILKHGLADRELFAMARIIQGERGDSHIVNEPRYPPTTIGEIRATRAAAEWATRAYMTYRRTARGDLIRATTDDILDAAKLMLAADWPDAVSHGQVTGPD